MTKVNSPNQAIFTPFVGGSASYTIQSLSEMNPGQIKELLGSCQREKQSKVNLSVGDMAKLTARKILGIEAYRISNGKYKLTVDYIGMDERQARWNLPQTSFTPNIRVKINSYLDPTPQDAVVAKGEPRVPAATSRLLAAPSPESRNSSSKVLIDWTDITPDSAQNLLPRLQSLQGRDVMLHVKFFGEGKVPYEDTCCFDFASATFDPCANRVCFHDSSVCRMVSSYPTSASNPTSIRFEEAPKRLYHGPINDEFTSNFLNQKISFADHGFPLLTPTIVKKVEPVGKGGLHRVTFSNPEPGAEDIERYFLPEDKISVYALPADFIKS